MVGITNRSRMGRQGMASQLLFAEIAFLSGDPARACMLHALMAGRALTATELARAARITPQPASSICADDCSGPPHRREAGSSPLSSPRGAFGCAYDGMHHAGRGRLQPDRKRLIVGPRDAALRKARTCYDHFAGQLGVALADALVEQGRIELTNDAGILTEAGVAFLDEIGIYTGRMRARGMKQWRRVLGRPCLTGASDGHISQDRWAQQPFTGRRAAQANSGRETFADCCLPFRAAPIISPAFRSAEVMSAAAASAYKEDRPLGAAQDCRKKRRQHAGRPCMSNALFHTHAPGLPTAAGLISSLRR